jgi:hypothetical protein
MKNRKVTYRVLVGGPGRRPPGRPHHRLEANIKMYLKKGNRRPGKD